jgi:hypothetical protein
MCVVRVSWVCHMRVVRVSWVCHMCGQQWTHVRQERVPQQEVTLLPGDVDHRKIGVVSPVKQPKVQRLALGLSLDPLVEVLVEARDSAEATPVLCVAATASVLSRPAPATQRCTSAAYI